MNRWKVAFFLLLGTIVLSITGFFIWVTSPSEDVPTQFNSTPNKPTDSVLSVEITTEDFEKIAMTYLEKELDNDSLPVEILINETIELKSELTVFGVTVPFSMEFDPIVNEQGNIHLKQTSVNIAKLNIPPITVLKLMSEAVQFPPWLVIRPNEEELFVDLSNLKLVSGAKVKAKEIDLKNDRILLEVIISHDN